MRFVNENTENRIIAHNDAMRIYMKRAGWCSTSEMFVAAGVISLQTDEEISCSFTCWLDKSVNEIFNVLSDRRFNITHY